MNSQTSTNDEFWNRRIDLGMKQMGNRTRRVMLKVHTSEEQCYDTSHEIVPVKRRQTRTYVAVRPYILQPNLVIHVGLYPQRIGDAIGEVTDSQVDGFQEIRIGNAQAWYYYDDDTLILWECYLYDRYREGKPKDDDRMNFLWNGFENLLAEQFNPSHIYTPSWEPIYDKDDWQAFLESRGYERFNERSFRKKH